MDIFNKLKQNEREGREIMRDDLSERLEKLSSNAGDFRRINEKIADLRRELNEVKAELHSKESSPIGEEFRKKVEALVAEKYNIEDNTNKVHAHELAITQVKTAIDNLVNEFNSFKVDMDEKTKMIKKQILKNDQRIMLIEEELRVQRNMIGKLVETLGMVV